MGGVLSSPQKVVSGVSQGSILGPLLFSLYVTDLPNCLQASNALMYADNTVIYYAASDANDLLQLLNDKVKFFLDWSNKSNLLIEDQRGEQKMTGDERKRGGNECSTRSEERMRNFEDERNKCRVKTNKNG